MSTSHKLGQLSDRARSMRGELHKQAGGWQEALLAGADDILRAAGHGADKVLGHGSRNLEHVSKQVGETIEASPWLVGGGGVAGLVGESLARHPEMSDIKKRLRSGEYSTAGDYMRALPRHRSATQGLAAGVGMGIPVGALISILARFKGLGKGIDMARLLGSSDDVIKHVYGNVPAGAAMGGLAGGAGMAGVGALTDAWRHEIIKETPYYDKFKFNPDRKWYQSYFKKDAARRMFKKASQVSEKRAISGLKSYVKRKVFDANPQKHLGRQGGQWGGQAGEAFGDMFGFGQQGQDAGQMAGQRVGQMAGKGYKNLPRKQQDTVYNVAEHGQPFVDKAINAGQQFLQRG